MVSSNAASLSIDDATPGENTDVFREDDAYITVEDESKRGVFEKHYVLSDGSFVALSYAEAIHYLDDDGVWKEVDNELTYDNNTMRYSTANENFKVSLAENATSQNLISRHLQMLKFPKKIK